MSNTAGDEDGISADAIRSIRGMTDAQIEAGEAKSGRRFRICAGATAVCFLAGIWLDWRYLPTALVPALAMVVYGHVAGLGRKELARRRNSDERPTIARQRP